MKYYRLNRLTDPQLVAVFHTATMRHVFYTGLIQRFVQYAEYEQMKELYEKAAIWDRLVLACQEEMEKRKYA